jgi:hypothetical protein
MQHDSTNYQEFLFVQAHKTYGAANSVVLFFYIVTDRQEIDDRWKATL